MRAWRDEFKKFKLNGKCPGCAVRFFNPLKAFNSWKMFDGNGEQISALTPMWRLQTGAYMICQKCHYRMEVFETGVTARDTIELIDMTETHRTEEPIGRDERLIDNTGSPSPVTRKLIVSREWRRECKVEREISDRDSQSLSLGDDYSGKLAFEAERLVRQRYEIIDETRQLYSEEITIAVPAGVRLRILIDWKYILQHGEVTLRDSVRGLASCRFRMTAGLTFDQTQLTDSSPQQAGQSPPAS